MPAADRSDVAFVVSFTGGRLQAETLLLVESLRRWGESHAEAPVYAICPRASEQPDRSAVERARAMGVEYVSTDFGPRHAQVPNADKIFASAYAEREFDHETLVFVDSDTVFLNGPDELASGDWVAAARPVDRRIAGSRGKGQNEPFWQRVYETLGARGRPFVETTVGQLRIRAYWNTGLLAGRREAGLFGSWEQAFRLLVERDVVHPRMPYFTEQISWAGVLADLHDEVRVLPVAYNYPLPHRGAMGADARELELSELVHLHYRLWFHAPDSLRAVHPPFDPGGDRYRWLEQRLPLEPLVDSLD